LIRLRLAPKAHLIAGFELVPNGGSYQTPEMNRAFSALISRGSYAWGGAPD
jgi:hypothetical protein